MTFNHEGPMGPKMTCCVQPPAESITKFFKKSKR